MTMNEMENIINHAAFEKISEASKSKLLESKKYLVYAVGQPLCVSNIQPNKILLILEGEARILGISNNKAFTVEKITKGAFVGLASFLNACACEEVSAINDVKVVAFDDQLILDIYINEESFRDWCKNKLFTSEVIRLAENIRKNRVINNISISDYIKKLIKDIKLFSITNEGKVKAEDGRIIISGSRNITNFSFGEKIERNMIIKSNKPLLGRVYSLSQSILEEDNIEELKKINEEVQSKENFEKAPSFNESTTLRLGKYEAKKKFKLIKGDGDIEETLACFKMLCSVLDIPFRKDAIEKILKDVKSRGQSINIELCGGLASMLGLHATGVTLPTEFGSRLQTPSLVIWKDSFALIKSSDAKGLIIASPKDGLLEINSDELEQYFPDGINMLVTDKTNSTPENNFNFNWFWPSLKKYKNTLLQVLIASFIVQLFGLTNPLLVQVIIDKVISQRSLDTLQILGFALVFVTLLGGLMGSLRTFLFTETTNRIDTRLGSEVIDHLLRLPLNYFDNRPVGELGSRIGELEKIRNFLTGQALTTILDAIFSIIYILVMFLYSWLLTIIALLVVPIQIFLTLIGAPLIRRQIREVAIENAKTQSHLVEVITGIQTVKAQNVETVSRWKWQDFYNKYISKTFQKTITGTALGETSKVLQQISQLLVLWVGATLVLKGQLTLGQLIAFRIISGYVTQPLLRLSTIWQELQQLRVSFERLADIIDTPEESNLTDKSNIPLPSIKGNVDFENVCFTFQKGSKDVLSNINLQIKAGTFVGIVGQSGSGKSTLMKLLPRLYEPREGKILIDGYDINKIELYSLRRQIGIVPQDPLLFAGSVSENIALTEPNADSESIIKAAKAADAHDFIMNLPNGYSSNVGERGSALSGGQRQRIAIARTLLNNPRLLILDEATSALDFETERRVCDNLKELCKNSTVFFITHRLNTIKNANLVVMLHKGVLDEMGTHNELISKQGRYFALYRQQESQ